MTLEIRRKCSWRSVFWISLGFWTTLHVLFAWMTPVSGDEAYYWDCARHLDWSSFDQPLLMIWSINPFRWVFGESSLAVRAPAIIASFLLGIFLLGLLRRFGGNEREATLSYALLHAMPLFFLGSFYESTDIGMSAAYMAATWAAVAIAQGDERGWWGFGLATGLGFLAKFPVVLVLPALVPALWCSKARRDLKTPIPWLAALLSVALTTPVWIWAAQHDWANFRFQLESRHHICAIGLRHLGEFVGANFLLATPLIAVAMLISILIFVKEGRPDRLVLAVATAMPFVFFGLVSLREEVGAHWGGPGLALGTAVLVLTPFKGRRVLLSLGAFMGLSLSIAAILIISFPEKLMDIHWRYSGKPRRINTRQLERLLGNEEMLRQIEARRRPGEPVFFTSYSNTHLFALLSKGKLPTRLANILEGGHGLASLYWYPEGDLLGGDLTIVSSKERRAQAWLADNCRTFDVEDPVEFRRNGKVIRSLAVFRCHGLMTDGGLFGRLKPSKETRGP